MIYDRHPELQSKWDKAFWARGYYVETVGNITDEAVQKYIRAVSYTHLVSIVYNGTEYLYRAPKPALWRASTENDKGNSFRAKSSVWMAADVFSLCTGCEVTEYAKSFANTGDTKKEAAGADEGLSLIHI